MTRAALGHSELTAKSLRTTVAPYKKTRPATAIRYIACSVVLLMALSVQSFAQETSVFFGDNMVRMYLEKENEKYSIKNVKGYEDAFIERRDDKVYLLHENRKTFLGELGINNWKSSPDVLIYSATFDGTMYFLIRDCEAASNVVYSIVDKNGIDVSLQLFDKKIIKEMREINPQEDGEGFLLPNPSFDDEEKTLTLSNNGGPAPYCIICKYKKGKYFLH